MYSYFTKGRISQDIINQLKKCNSETELKLGRNIMIEKITGESFLTISGMIYGSEAWNIYEKWMLSKTKYGPYVTIGYFPDDNEIKEQPPLDVISKMQTLYCGNKPTLMVNKMDSGISALNGIKNIILNQSNNKGYICEIHHQWENTSVIFSIYK
jgi:hypothetical protein